ncbi:MAG: hypothetical protein ACFB16_23040 [Phormidesmis sp.]
MLAVGDRISIKVVDVGAPLTEPASTRKEILNTVENERRAHYERLKADYEWSSTQRLSAKGYRRWPFILRPPFLC